LGYGKGYGGYGNWRNSKLQIWIVFICQTLNQAFLSIAIF
jgi:hypothetical protein